MGHGARALLLLRRVSQTDGPPGAPLCPPPRFTTHLIRSAENSQKEPEPTTHCPHTHPLPRLSSLPSVCPSRSASPPPPPSFFLAFMRLLLLPRSLLHQGCAQEAILPDSDGFSGEDAEFCNLDEVAAFVRSVLRWTEVQVSSGLTHQPLKAETQEMNPGLIYLTKSGILEH